MNTDNRSAIEAYIAEGDANRENEEWGLAKVGYQKALDKFKSVESIADNDPDELITADDKILKTTIEKNITQVDYQLARSHREWGIGAVKSKDFHRAIEEFEEAINLATENELAFIEEVKIRLDQAKLKYRDSQLHSDITPSIERGDDFRHEGHFGEAIIEYQDAFKSVVGLPPNHRFVQYLQLAMRECRRQLIKPYLNRISRARAAGKTQQAFKLAKRAVFMVDKDDFVYRAFLDRIGEEIAAMLSQTEIDDKEEVDSPEAWSQAVKDYEEALDLYSSFTQTDPLSPVYADGNIYEDKFLIARRKLANLYKNRADRFRDKVQVEKAIKNYKEALKLFPKSDKAFHDTFKEIKKLRAQVSNPSAA